MFVCERYKFKRRLIVSEIIFVIFGVSVDGLFLCIFIVLIVVEIVFMVCSVFVC